MDRAEIDILLVSSPENIHYLIPRSDDRDP
jgi:hypothetical protein